MEEFSEYWLYTVKEPDNFSTRALVSRESPALFVIAQEHYKKPLHIVYAEKISVRTARVLIETYGY